MKRDEHVVIDAFCTWLEDEGWSVEREVAFVDVVAEREGRRLLAKRRDTQRHEASTSTRCTAKCCGGCHGMQLTISATVTEPPTSGRPGW